MAFIRKASKRVVALAGAGVCLATATADAAQITASPDQLRSAAPAPGSAGEPSEAEPPASPVPAQAAASKPDTQGQPDSDKSGLADIIVTAQRRSENIQDVPIAIAVVNGSEIAQSGYKGLADIQYLAPGVQYNPAGGSGFQVRGVGTQVFDYSTEQAVGIVIDDVVYDLPRNPGIDGLPDVDRVEILKGPQGTLFGKNASAGIISVTTKRPNLNAIEGGVLGSYGSRSDRRINGDLNLPIGGVAALRVSGFHNGQTGFTYNPVLGRNLGSVSNLGARAKLLVEPAANVDFMLTGDVSRHRDNTPAFGVLRSANAQYSASSAAAGVSVSPSNLDIADSVLPYQRYTNKGASLIANLKLDAATLTSITAYRTLDYRQSAPLSFEPTLEYIPYNIGGIKGKKFSQEFRVASSGHGRLRYVLGLYFNQLTLDSTQEQAGRLGAPLPPDVFLSPTNGVSLFHNRITSKAAFANVNVDVTDNFEVVLGGRVTSDINSARFAYDSAPLSYFYIPVSATPDPDGRVTKTNFSYRVAPTYKINDNVRVYLTRATGYKGPGIAYLSGLQQPYRDETVSSWEVGLKSELLDRSVRLNVDAFTQKYKDFQAQDIRFVNGVPLFFIVNAGGLRTRGVEAQVDWRVSSAFLLGGGVTYAKSIFTDYISSGVQLAGNSLTNAPRVSATAHASLDQPVSDGLIVHGAVNASYRSETFQLVADPTSRQTGYALVNGELGIGAANDRWRGGLYFRNLFDQDFTVATTTLAFGTARLVPNDAQRTVGGFVQFNF